MENKSLPQEELFRRIRFLISPHVSMVDEIAEILQISNDSAYRRIRGEKQLLLDEFIVLCLNYHISADELYHLEPGVVIFQQNALEETTRSFDNYLGTIYDDLKNLCRQEKPHLYLIFNELNIFQLLLMPEVAAFKFFFWSKSNLGFPGYQDKKYTTGQVTAKTRKLISDILLLYNSVPSTELITVELLSSMLKQLAYYDEAGYFESSTDISVLSDELSCVISHMKRQAELGYKFDYGIPPSGIGGNYQLYLNDLVMVDNTVIASSEQTKAIYMTFNAVNLLISYNREFYRQNLQWAQNLVGKSTLISGAAERDRNKFFRNINDQIAATRLKLGV